MSSTTSRSAPSQPRARLALTVAVAMSAAAALAAPTGAFAAQGDDDVVIGVIERSTPMVVTIQAEYGQQTTAEDSDDQGQAEDSDDQGQAEDSDDQGQAEDDRIPEDLQGLLPEGFQLPDPGQSIPQGGTGSGVIISSDGLIITNGHVVGDAKDVTVLLDDGTVLDGTVTGVDTLTDFAFVKVDGADLPAATLGDSSALKVGQLAIAVGNPLGRFPSSAAVGIVSGLDRSIDVFGGLTGGEHLNHLIQTDAAVNSGNSGGALLDGDGSLVGIITAEAGMSDGIGFALPIDLAKPIITQAEAGDDIARPYVGVVFREIDAQVAKDESLPVTSGALVAGSDGEAAIVDGGPADEAGLEDGDIITAVDGLSVDRDNPLDLQVLRFAPGDEVTLQVLRDGKSLDLPTTLGTRPADLG